MNDEVPCKTHTDAPHGFCRDESITQDRYVCECEFWEPPEQAEQPNTQFMEGYRIGLAEMREKCAAVSEQGTGEAVQKAALELLLNERKRIAAAIRSIKFEGDTGFRSISEMVAEHKQDQKKAAAIEKAKMRKATRAEKIVRPGMYKVPAEQAECKECGAKQAQIDRLMLEYCPDEMPPEQLREWGNNQRPVEQAEQEQVFISNEQFRSMHFSKVTVYTQNDGKEVIVCTPIRTHIEGFWCEDLTCAKCYSAEFRLKHTHPVRTKDLTDEEIVDIMKQPFNQREYLEQFARAVISKFKEKNK